MKSYVKLLLLQEPEIRKAAALLKRWREVAEREPKASNEEYRDALYDALQAAVTALQGADEYDHVLMLTSHTVNQAIVEGDADGG
jgi:hypothetical protein